MTLSDIQLINARRTAVQNKIYSCRDKAGIIRYWIGDYGGNLREIDSVQASLYSTSIVYPEADIPVPTVFPPSGPAGGDLTGTYPDPTIAFLQGSPLLIGTPSALDVLTYDGSTWVPSPSTPGFITSILDTSTIDLSVIAGVLTANFINSAGYITSVPLNSTQIGFGSAGNVLTGSADLTWNNTSKDFIVNGTIDLDILNSSNAAWIAQGDAGYWFTGPSSTGLLGHRGFGVDLKTTAKYTMGDAASGSGNSNYIEINDTSSTVKLSTLAGTGTRIVTADSTGILGTGWKPNTFNFTDLTNQLRGAVISSSTETLSGDSTQVWNFAVRGNSSQLSINGGTWAPEGIARTGDTIQLRMTSSSSPSTATVANLYTNGLLVDWSITTAAFVPTDISGMTLWLDSNTGVTKDGSNLVSAWADQSGSGNNATQGTGSFQPLWVNSVLNGYPAIRFDGSDNLMDIPSLAYYSIFAVIKHDTTPFPDYNGVIGGNAGLANNGHILIGVGGTTKMARGISSFTTVYRNTVSVSFSGGYDMSPITTAFLGTFLYTTGVTQASTLGLASGGARYWDGDIYEICVFNSVLSGSDLTNMHSYLMTKYAL